MTLSTHGLSKLNDQMFSVGNLYVAYRKAKTEAFYENTHFNALAFTKFEQALHNNILRLHKRLIARKPDWFQDSTFIGDHAYLPKSVSTDPWESQNDGHFRALDPISDWQYRFDEAGEKATTTLRLVIRPTVEFQIVSALWIIHVGHLFDATIDPRSSFGNRLRRSKSAMADRRVSLAGLNFSTPGLFVPYFTAYREWRELGLRAME